MFTPDEALSNVKIPKVQVSLLPENALAFARFYGTNEPRFDQNTTKHHTE